MWTVVILRRRIRGAVSTWGAGDLPSDFQGGRGRETKGVPKTRAREGRRKPIEFIGTKFAKEECCRLGLKTFECAGVSQAESGGSGWCPEYRWRVVRTLDDRLGFCVRGRTGCS